MNVIRLIIVAVGGQGNLLAAKVLGEAALLAGIPVNMSEIHGMAQRGGVVESAVVSWKPPSLRLATAAALGSCSTTARRRLHFSAGSTRNTAFASARSMQIS